MFWPTVLALLQLAADGRTDEFVLGYLTGSRRRPGDIGYSKPGRTISGAISLAVEEINAGSFKDKGHSLSFLVAETYGEESTSILETAELWKKNISAFIGPQETCLHEARMAAAFNLPMFSYYCMDSDTSDKTLFPTFARTRPPDTQISKSVAAVLKAFNWTQVTFFYSNADDTHFGKIASTISEVFSKSGIEITAKKTWDTHYLHGYTANPFVKLVADTYQDTRIYVVLGNYYDHTGLIVAMDEMDLFKNGEYFVVGVDVEQYDAENPGKYLTGMLSNKPDPILEKAFRSFFSVVPTPPRGFKNFSVKVNEYMEKPPFQFPNPLVQLGGVKQISVEAAYLYDAVHLYARCVLEMIECGDDPRNGSAMMAKFKGSHYKSALGYGVYMDENGDAEGNYTLVSRQRQSDASKGYGLFPAGRFAKLRNLTKNPELTLVVNVEWISGKPPVAEPACGYRGQKCITHTAEILSIVAGTLLLVLAIISLVFYRNWKYEQELDSLLWKVDYKDIEINDTENSSTSSKISRALHPLIRTSQVSLSSNPDADFRYSSIFTAVGIYKGRVFAIKNVKKKSIDITRAMKKELKVMRDLRHENLNGFIGACTDPPNICIVTEYCNRGSLKDILENEDVKLDNMFVASLVADIIRGMLYLHDSPLRYHGNLKSSNCLVDSRWVLKLTDFGLQEFKKESEDFPHHFLQHDFRLQKDDEVDCKCEGLLYISPELLRCYNSSIQISFGTQKGDVYSFSIILYELHSRKGPFGENHGLGVSDILRKIIYYPQDGSNPFRPPLELLENNFDFVRDCLEDCWAENPDDRPDFKTIRVKLRPMRKGMRPNIFDNMMAMMEKYANNLEVLVDERTDQLVEEKKKTDALLYEMLPKYVAEQLKRGHKVQAENFDCVTIYFSDIVGFTSMSAESTPFQVVDFLNDLYTCFDSIIENYDVYKVETIGDAYMVVSGLPIKNGDMHAAEIATMSLHLLEAVKKFQIRHRPYDSLRLRIGIHSGPVCAGVVGLKMPRYCLFGDTVNTTSRMESTGQALKIHCSNECRTLLERLGGYQTAERGLVEMKGKGNVRTYWLVGEDHLHRLKRDEFRAQRREQQTGSKHRKSSRQQKSAKDGPRSSLKVPKTTMNGPLSRCCSLESPKKLRFAMHHDDGTPVRRRPSGVAEEEDEYCCDRHLSVSCPCIDHFDQDPSSAGKRPTNCGTLLQAPAVRVPGFPRVNSAPVTPMAADCLEMTAVSSLSAMDDVNEPLIKSDDYCKDGAITFV
ncbi:guanylate cyclase 32E isoform X1 [Myzus persicae]|uniref:guanylate cyclase 32E isoform X1 n=2 Tax=Myzus persicae TaxID=13164 RepID=UPI000B9328F9|nr:guanylate cyclase 32E isoform X1 [Myzus persicae]XP_022181655.1 guanylate cyclase 32E isoform X1 [Myzus persicae]XP_022181656.1 guanylate cyclase 32E isoform X1 [Myzus persicae]